MLRVTNRVVAMMMSVLTMLGACHVTYPDHVEAADVRFTKRALRRQSDGTPVLDLAGFIFHSSLAVRGVTVQRQDGKVHVMVALTPIGRGGDGNFTAEIPLVRPDEPVVFGTKAVAIWPEAREH